MLPTLNNLHVRFIKQKLTT